MIELSQQNPRLLKQLAFIVEIDKVKAIFRKSKLFSGERYENDAEHSWTICIMAILLQEYANFEVDILRVTKMLLLHDIVEIDAGDTFLYAKERASANALESAAAERLFGMLESDQRDEYLQLWEEFERKESNDAKFAAVFDRLEPMLQNYLTQGCTWQQNQITYEMVIEKNQHIQEGSEAIWRFVLAMLEQAVAKGYLPRGAA